MRREGREPGREASSVSVWERARVSPGGLEGGKEDLVGVVVVVVTTEEEVVVTEEEGTVEVDPDPDGTVKC